MVYRVQKANMHHCTKFHRNPSNNCGNISIFLCSRWLAFAILDFWKFRFQCPTWSRGSECITMSNFHQNRSRAIRGFEVLTFPIFTFFMGLVGRPCVGLSVSATVLLCNQYNGTMMHMHDAFSYIHLTFLCLIAFCQFLINEYVILC